MDQKLMQHRPLSAALISAFFEGSDAKAVSAKVAEVESSRMQSLFRTFPTSDTSTVRKAVSEYRKEHKGKPTQRTASTRAAEIVALYGAARWADLKPEGGYHALVASARDLLKAKGIRWDGQKIAEKWEKDIRAEVEQKAQVELAARMEVERQERATGQDLSDDAEKAFYTKADQDQAKAGMVKLATAIVKKYGADKALYLIEALEGAITASEQKTQEKKAA